MSIKYVYLIHTMKQIIQNLKSGETIIEEVPSPQLKSAQVLIQTTRSLISRGTERMLVEFRKANYLEKARQQPEMAKEVFDKMKTDGIKPTVDAVFNKLKLNHPLPLALKSDELESIIKGKRRKQQEY